MVALFTLLLSKCSCHEKLTIDKVLIDIIYEDDDKVLNRKELRKMVLKLLQENEFIKLDLNAKVNTSLKVVFRSISRQNNSDKPVGMVDLVVNQYIDSKRYTYHGAAVGKYPEKDLWAMLFNSSLNNLINDWRIELDGNAELIAIINQYLKDKSVAKSEVELAVYMLGIKKEVNAVTLLGKILLGPSNKLSLLALVSLTQIADPNSIEYITQFAERKNVDIRKQAVLAARQIGGKKAAAWLFTLSTGHADPEIRQLAGEALLAVEKKTKID